MSGQNFEWPKDGEHLLTVGQTGSGKTQAMAYVLAKAPFHLQPFVIIDYKGDPLLNSIERVREIRVGEIPEYPGLYITHPIPELHDDAINDFFHRCCQRGNVGLMIDEALDLPSREAPFRRVLTQGRTLGIPVIAGSQRPYDLSTYLFTEARHIWKFKLMRPEDNKKIFGYMPENVTKSALPKFHSLWYNAGQDAAYRLLPVPQAEKIAEEISTRLPKMKRVV